LVNHIAWLRKLWVVMLFLFLLGPALFAIAVGDVHLTPFRVLMPLYVYLFFLAFCVHQGRIGFDPKVGKYLLFLALWLLWAVMSLFWASPSVGTARHLVALSSGILLILFSLLFLNTEKGIRSIYGLWVTFAVIVIGIGIWEAVTGSHLSISREGQYVGIRSTYPSAVFVNPNDFATFLCLSFPFMFIGLSFLKSAFPKVLVVLLMLTSLYFIGLASSRANIIALMLGVSLIFLLPRVRDRLKPVATILMVVVVIVFLGYALSSPAMSSYFDVFRDIPRQVSSLNLDDVSTETRTNLMRNGLALLQGSHFLGVGAGGFESHMAEGSVYYTWGITNAHNWWLEILVDYGVLIFALFLAFYIGLLWNLYRIYRRSESLLLKSVSLATFISLAMFSVACLSSSGLVGALFVWFLFATALCITSRHRVAKGEKPT